MLSFPIEQLTYNMTRCIGVTSALTYFIYVEVTIEELNDWKSFTNIDKFNLNQYFW